MCRQVLGRHVFVEFVGNFQIFVFRYVPAKYALHAVKYATACSYSVIVSAVSAHEAVIVIEMIANCNCLEGTLSIPNTPCMMTSAQMKSSELIAAAVTHSPGVHRTDCDWIAV